MAASDVFFDSNILIYLLSGHDARAKISDKLVTEGGNISVQVLNEFVAVARRKEVKWPVIHEFLEAFQDELTVLPLTVEVHRRGVAIVERHKLSTFDSMLLAAAQLSGCRVMYSEDMGDGQVIGGVTIRNPYKLQG